jgi:hypothetical protein
MSRSGAARQTSPAVRLRPKPPVIPPALSLQEKLDRIAHEREVLALQSELARDGLREGDTVRRLGGDASGRLTIARDEHPPRLLVRADDGTLIDYSPALWRRA